VVIALGYIFYLNFPKNHFGGLKNKNSLIDFEAVKMETWSFYYF
jgi:hypothetical protein